MDEIGIFAILICLPRIASIKHYANCRGSAGYDSQGVSFANVENERVIRRTVEQALSLEVVKWAVKKNLVFIAVYRGWNPTQVYRDYNKPL